MSRALIAVCLALQAIPARALPSSVHARATAPLDSGRRSVEIWSEGRQLATGTWLTSDDRHHVAFRNPLGQPVSIVRVADGLVGLELVGDREIVAADASSALLELTGGLADASDLAGLLLDRIPARAVVEARGGGFVAIGPDFLAELDGGVRVVRASLGPLRLERTPGGVRVTEGGVAIDVRFGHPEAASLPPSAFAIGTEQGVPTVSAERVARRLLGLR